MNEIVFMMKYKQVPVHAITNTSRTTIKGVNKDNAIDSVSTQYCMKTYSYFKPKHLLCPICPVFMEATYRK